MKQPYPIIIDLTHKKIAVVGGGKVAARKISKLLAAGSKPVVISPKLNPAIDPTKVEWIKGPYQRDRVAEMDIIIACTDNPIVNEQIKKEASHFQLVNNTSDKRHSDFYNLATIMVDDILLGISTMGKSPSLAKQVKNELSDWLKKRHWRE
ncbi:bifunctional precorrin-2 dehydrogenase/sirohydrochlorin ferrochelatase [Lactobacillus sp. 3B(2020)]|nr:bifunctional precorrin-2 dehydrogenase/sirohydrochlorin ferrochelatase [Lactobacillus sp. 3B(2020)]